MGERSGSSRLSGLLLGLAATAVALLLLFPRQLAEMVGLDVTDAPTSVAPDFFDAPSEAPASPAADEGLEPPVQAVEAAPAPNPDKLNEALRALPTPSGTSVAISYDVRDVATGEVVASRAPDQLLVPASNAKLLTALAVTHAFQPTDKFSTRVVLANDDTVVLVGGGDPLLAVNRTPAGTYPNRASLQALAAQTADGLKRLGKRTVKIGFDSSYFPPAAFNPKWDPADSLYVTPISALWADTGLTPQGQRSATPDRDAAVQFARLLTEAGITVEGDVNPANGAQGDVLTVAESPPVHVLLEQAMLTSDNSWTEVMGFQLALHRGLPATFEGSSQAIEAELREMGIWTDGAVLRDASGLSGEDRASAQMLSEAARQAALDPHLQVVMDGLPVAGVTGTLADRFTDEVAAPARGVARAKTGTLANVSTLSGTTVTADGSVLAYAVMTNGFDSLEEARRWTDQVVGTITSCGCQ